MLLLKSHHELLKPSLVLEDGDVLLRVGLFSAGLFDVALEVMVLGPNYPAKFGPKFLLPLDLQLFLLTNCQRLTVVVEFLHVRVIRGFR